MEISSRIAPIVIAAYRAAQYQIDAGFMLSIDHHSAALAAWHSFHDVDRSALLTACNPMGRQIGERQNRKATAALTAWLDKAGWPISAATGLDPRGQWPAEPGFLIAGLGLEAARDLGRLFQQNAIVWAGPDAIPRLILLR